MSSYSSERKNQMKDNTTSSAFDGISVKHEYKNPQTRRIILFNQNEGAYDNVLSCKTGVSNIDNNCVCPGSMNTLPYLEETSFHNLWSPENGYMFPEPSASQKCIMAQRKPRSLAQPYEPFLGDCNY